MNVRTEPTFQVLSRETLFAGPYSGIDPHPDGTHIVAIKRGGADEGRVQDRHLYFVVNWLEGVKARLGSIHALLNALSYANKNASVANEPDPRVVRPAGSLAIEG